MTQSLYTQLGGEEAVETVVAKLFRRVAEDEQLAHYFEEVELDTHQGQLAAFISMVAGGSDNYNGRSMEAAHEHLEITTKEFNMLADHLSDALDEVGVETEQQEELLSAVAQLENDVVSS